MEGRLFGTSVLTLASVLLVIFLLRKKLSCYNVTVNTCIGQLHELGFDALVVISFNIHIICWSD